MKNKAVFLDRDGVIIQEPPHYAHTPDQMRLIPGIKEAIRLLNENDFKVIVVTNQAGVAKGYYTEEEVISFNKLMKEELELYNAKIDAILYCCHNSEAKVERYRKDCDCRKPKPGMLKRAEKELNIDLNVSYMIGDKKSDIDAGKSIGCKTILVLTGYGTEELKRYDIEYDHIAKDLYEAVINILS